MIIRSLPSRGEEIFLTFDDGPAAGTERVLDVLAQHEVRATFFLISAQALAHPEIVERIRREGHALGSHSPDHAYRNFFRPTNGLREWIARAEKDFATLGVKDLVGFRPPAGIVTRHLRRISDQDGLPVILWNERFFDAVVPWGLKRALHSARNLRGGSIVLLHDRQPSHRIEKFCATLSKFIVTVKSRGLRLAPLKVDSYPLSKN